MFEPRSWFAVPRVLQPTVQPETNYGRDQDILFHVSIFGVVIFLQLSQGSRFWHPGKDPKPTEHEVDHEESITKVWAHPAQINANPPKVSIFEAETYTCWHSCRFSLCTKSETSLSFTHRTFERDRGGERLANRLYINLNKTKKRKENKSQGRC